MCILPGKAVSEMTYTVSGGTLLTHCSLFASDAGATFSFVVCCQVLGLWVVTIST